MTPFVIKKMRRKHHLSQEELAFYTGTNVRTIIRWEAGEYKPRGSALILLRAIWKYKHNALSIIKNLRWDTKFSKRA